MQSAEQGEPRPTARLERRLVALVLAVALVVLFVESRHAPFEMDEADYVATSRYFGYLVFQRDVARKEWDQNHWTLTQPPLTRYIVGAWLSVSGYDLEKMNQPYVSTASSFEVNRMKGRVPTDEVLGWARLPMVAMAAGSVVLLVLLAAQFGGWPAGLATAALALSSAFVRYTYVHVWAEAPLAFFYTASVLLSIVLARAIWAGRPWRRSLAGLTLAVGGAATVKLTGLLALPVLALCAAVGVLAAYVGRSSGAPGRPAPLPLARRVAAAVVVVTLGVLAIWVAVNPFLWRGPVDGTRAMLANRAEEMAFQQQQWPEYAVLDARERPWLTLTESLNVGPFGDHALGTAANAAFLVVGLGVLAHLVARGRRTVEVGVLAIWIVTVFAAIVLGLGLKYPRYFMPTTLLFLPVAGLGLAWTVRRCVGAFPARRARATGVAWQRDAAGAPR